jgi:hypothetical protein
MQPRRGAIGFPTPARPSPFPTERSVFFLGHRPPNHLRNLGSSSRTLRSSPEYFPLRSRPRPESLERLPWGSRSLFATSTFRVRAASFQLSLPCRPRRFSRPRRVTPRMALRVYFTPLPRLGFTLQGFVHRPQPYRLSATVCPLVVVPTSLRAVTHSLRSAGPRPQGFHPRPSPELTHRGLADDQVRSPLEFSSSRFSHRRF